MSEIGAYTPETARFIRDVVNRLVQSGALRTGAITSNPNHHYQQGLCYKTPADGIPANGKALCTQQTFVSDIESSELIDEVDADGNAVQHDVHNVFSSDIGGDAIILCLWMYGRRVAHAEDCQ